MRSTIIHRRQAAHAAAVFLATAGTLAAGSVLAFEFQNSSGTLTGSWDTTLSYGQSTRVTSRDCRLIAIANGGCGYSPNFDNGDINYPTGVFSRAYKATSELSLKYGNFGAFVRGSHRRCVVLVAHGEVGRVHRHHEFAGLASDRDHAFE